MANIVVSVIITTLVMTAVAVFIALTVMFISIVKEHIELMLIDRAHKKERQRRLNEQKTSSDYAEHRDV